MSVSTRNSLRSAINSARLTELKPLAYHLRLSVRGNKPQYIDALQSYLDDAANDAQVLRARLVEFASAAATAGAHRLASLFIENLVADYALWHAQRVRAANPQAALRPPPPPQTTIGHAPSSLQERLANIQRAAAATPMSQHGASSIETPWGSVNMAECKFRIDPYFELVAPLAMRKLSAGDMADRLDFKLGHADVRLLMDEPARVHLALLVTYQDALYLSAKHTVKPAAGHGVGSSPCYALLESRLMASVAVNGTQIKFHKNPSYLIDKGKADKVHPILLTGNVRRDTSTQSVAITTQVSPSTSLIGLVAVVRQFTPEQVLDKIRRASIAERIAEIQASNKPTDDDDDDDDFDLDIKVATMDPVLMTRITTPLRSTSCKHADCCDALTFLRQNAQTPTYTCPHCNHEIGSLPDTMDFGRVFAEPLGPKLSDRLKAERRKPSVLVAQPVLERLRVDEHFADMLGKVADDIEQVQLEHKSGHWVIPGPKPAPPARLPSPPKLASSQPTRESTPIILNSTSSSSTRSSSPALVAARSGSRAPSSTPAPADRVVVELLDSDDDAPPVHVARRQRPVQRTRPVSRSVTPAAAGPTEVVDLMSDSDDEAPPPRPAPPATSPPPVPTPTPSPPAPAPAPTNGSQSGPSALAPRPPSPLRLSSSPVPSSPLRLSSPLRRPRSAVSDDDDENDGLVRMSPHKRRRRNVIGDGDGEGEGEGEGDGMDVDKVPAPAPLATGSGLGAAGAGADGLVSQQAGAGDGVGGMEKDADKGPAPAAGGAEKDADKEPAPMAGAAGASAQRAQAPGTSQAFAGMSINQILDQLQHKYQQIQERTLSTLAILAPTPSSLSSSSSAAAAPGPAGQPPAQVDLGNAQRRIAQLERDLLRARLELEQQLRETAQQAQNRDTGRPTPRHVFQRDEQILSESDLSDFDFDDLDLFTPPPRLLSQSRVTFSAGPTNAPSARPAHASSFEALKSFIIEGDPRPQSRPPGGSSAASASASASARTSAASSSTSSTTRPGTPTLGFGTSTNARLNTLPASSKSSSSSTTSKASSSDSVGASRTMPVAPPASTSASSSRAAPAAAASSFFEASRRRTFGGSASGTRQVPERNGTPIPAGTSITMPRPVRASMSAAESSAHRPNIARRFYSSTATSPSSSAANLSNRASLFGGVPFDFFGGDDRTEAFKPPTRRAAMQPSAASHSPPPSLERRPARRISVPAPPVIARTSSSSSSGAGAASHDDAAPMYRATLSDAALVRARSQARARAATSVASTPAPAGRVDMLTPPLSRRTPESSVIARSTLEMDRVLSMAFQVSSPYRRTPSGGASKAPRSGPANARSRVQAPSAGRAADQELSALTEEQKSVVDSIASVMGRMRGGASGGAGGNGGAKAKNK